MTDYSVVRDQWGRPFVTTDGGPLQFKEGRKTPTNAVGYTRVSTLAGVLDDKENLAPWKAAMTAIGVVREPSVYAQLGSLMSKHKDPWNSAKYQMKQLVERAQQAASSDDGSGKGTAFHEFTEVVDEGRWPEFLPPALEPWLTAYAERIAEYDILLAEGFVVVDELQAAGSFDKLMRHKETGVIRIGDLKSGKSDPMYPMKAMIQFAAYAHGELYDQSTGDRKPVHPDIDLKEALLIHAPIRSELDAYCKVYPVDIEAGWEYAKLAVKVSAARKATKKALVAV